MIYLQPLHPEDRNQFILDNQEALGYASKPLQEPKPRKADYIYWIK